MPPQASAGGRMCSSAKGGVWPWTSPEPTGGQWALAACCVQGLGSGPMPGHCPVLPPPTLASLQSSMWEAVLQVVVNKSLAPLRWDPCGEAGGGWGEGETSGAAPPSRLLTDPWEKHPRGPTLPASSVLGPARCPHPYHQSDYKDGLEARGHKEHPWLGPLGGSLSQPALH